MQFGSGNESLLRKVVYGLVGNPDMEVDFISERNKLAIEIDGSHHFADRDAYRWDRRKDELLQETGYFILRFLADDVMNNLGEVMARVLRRLK